MDKIKDGTDRGEISEVRTNMVSGKIAICDGCAHIIGVEESVVESDRVDVVCIMCAKPSDDMRALPVDADFDKWVPERDGQWDSPPWYLNPRINRMIKVHEPHGRMAVWIQILDRKEETWQISNKYQTR